MNDSKRLEELKRDFDFIYKISLNKSGFLEREIEGYSKLLDDNKLKLPVLSMDDEPLVKYDIPYSSMNIFFIREFYDHFIVKGADVSDLEEKEPIDFSSWIREHYDFAEEALSEPSGPKHYYNLAKDLHEYLKWLQIKLKDSVKNSNEDMTIIDSLYLRLIFKEYGHNFENETLDSWLARFSKGHVEIDPIKVEPDAKPGTVKLKLIAILASIQKIPNTIINFESFVKTNFGINNFQSTKTKSQNKTGYKEIVKECDRILRK